MAPSFGECRTCAAHSRHPDDLLRKVMDSIPQMMKVAEYPSYGRADVVRIAQRPTPTPGQGEVLVRVQAAALNPKDVLTRAGKFALFAGRSFPKRMGYDFSGEIAVLGPGVRDLRVGDAVFGMIQAWRAGACAEHVVVKTSELAAKPASLSWEHAAALPLASLTALQALRDHGHVRPGQRVLINGASGGVGAHAVQIAKALGAHVIAVASARNADFVAQLGADEVLDYACADIEHIRPGVDTYFDAFGNRSLARIRSSLNPGGTYVTTIPSPTAVLDHLRTMLAKVRSRLVVVRSNRADLEYLARLSQTGALRAIVEQTFVLEDLAKAQIALESRRARGKLVIRVGSYADQLVNT